MSTKKSTTVIITGASSGIGFALAKAYLERGANVVGNARTEERLAEAARQIGEPKNFLRVAGDISLKSTAENLFQRAIEAFGHVDILINNAGIFTAKPFVDYSPEDIDALVNTNLKGFVYPSQQAAAHMVPRKQGHIVTITASIGLQPLSQAPSLLPVLVKGGLNQATKALALELAPHNVQVNAVAPGIIDTPLIPAEAHESLKTLQPAGRIGKVEDIVDAVLYLTSASFTTGVVLPVDGGMSAGK